MIKKFYPSSLYNFLRFIQSNPVNKRILDCGAGGPNPKLAFFYENGFETYGIDISENEIKDADDYCKNHDIKLNIIKGDMRNIPFDSNFFGYVFSYLSMIHLSKNATAQAINEIYRVLMKGGLCCLNFLSKDDKWFDENEETKPGEIISKHGSKEEIHSYYDDDEPDGFFHNFDILYKEKRHILKGNYFNTGRTCILDYIIKK
ncbi:MAG: class I SAM-dependent methyltransferase [Candidatus Lokiarchaeota archaeon]|nr:class I SAM-dependent methyltransferase [Candidatus Lokiarchaeota archaeon]